MTLPGLTPARSRHNERGTPRSVLPSCSDSRRGRIVPFTEAVAPGNSVQEGCEAAYTRTTQRTRQSREIVVGSCLHHR